MPAKTVSGKSIRPGRYKPGKPMAEMQKILLPQWRRLITACPAVRERAA